MSNKVTHGQLFDFYAAMCEVDSQGVNGFGYVQYAWRLLEYISTQFLTPEKYDPLIVKPLQSLQERTRTEDNRDIICRAVYYIHIVEAALNLVFGGERPVEGSPELQRERDIDWGFYYALACAKYVQYVLIGALRARGEQADADDLQKLFLPKRLDDMLGMINIPPLPAFTGERTHDDALFEQLLVVPLTKNMVPVPLPKRKRPEKKKCSNSDPGPMPEKPMSRETPASTEPPSAQPVFDGAARGARAEDSPPAANIQVDASEEISLEK